MRPDIKFALPLREAQKNTAQALFTLCSRLFTFVHDKKNLAGESPEQNKKPREPEKMTTLPEDERLMPENEPEKNLNEENSGSSI